MLPVVSAKLSSPTCCVVQIHFSFHRNTFSSHSFASECSLNSCPAPHFFEHFLQVYVINIKMIWAQKIESGSSCSSQVNSLTGFIFVVLVSKGLNTQYFCCEGKNTSVVLFSVETEFSCVIMKLVVLIQLKRLFKAWLKITWRSISSWQVYILVSKMWAGSASSRLKLDSRRGSCGEGHGLNMPIVSSITPTSYLAIPYFFRLRDLSLLVYWIIVWFGMFWTSCTAFFLCTNLQ